MTDKQYPQARQFFQAAWDMENGLVEAAVLQLPECVASCASWPLRPEKVTTSYSRKATSRLRTISTQRQCRPPSKRCSSRLPDSKDALILLKKTASALVTAMKTPHKYSQLKRLDEIAQTILRWDREDDLAYKWKKQADDGLSVDEAKAKQLLTDAEKFKAQGFYEDAVPLLNQRAKLMDNDMEAVRLLQETTDRAAAQDKKYQPILSAARTLRSQAEALVTQAQAKGTSKVQAKQNYTKAAAIFMLAREKYLDAVPLAPSQMKHDTQAVEGVNLCQKNAKLCTALGM